MDLYTELLIEITVDHYYIHEMVRSAHSN